MPEIAIAWKIIGGLYALLTGGIWWWITDLRSKQTRSTDRIDAISDKVVGQSERLTRIEAESITESEVIRMMNEMEQRIMNNFREFRLEFKEDLSVFRTDLKEDLRSLRDNRRVSD